MTCEDVLLHLMLFPEDLRTTAGRRPARFRGDFITEAIRDTVHEIGDTTSQEHEMRIFAITRNYPRAGSGYATGGGYVFLAWHVDNRVWRTRNGTVSPVFSTVNLKIRYNIP
jgi:hypothetical protein